MAADAVKMVVVNGVRYRPEDAPKAAQKSEPEVEEKAQPAPANKARTTTNKK